MLSLTVFLLVISEIGVIIADDLNHDYVISVVSSDENPGLPVTFVHAESPVWDPLTQSLYFVDVLEQNVHRLDYPTGKIFTKHIEYGQVNVVSLISDSSRLLVAVRSAMYLLDWNIVDDYALRLITTVDEGLPDNVINEGKPDAVGRYWAGTKGLQIGDDVVNDLATLYSFDENTIQNPVAKLRPVTISNGMVWSLNNTVMYYIDSASLRIDAFDYDIQNGAISRRRTIIDISDYGYEYAMPDGMTIDDQGDLWVALIFAGTVLHINPDIRQVVYAYELPASKVTSLAWGGLNLDELFVTTARDGIQIELEPLAGALFTIRNTGRRGVPPNYFRFVGADYY